MGGGGGGGGASLTLRLLRPPLLAFDLGGDADLGVLIGLADAASEGWDGDVAGTGELSTGGIKVVCAGLFATVTGTSPSNSCDSIRAFLREYLLLAKTPKSSRPSTSSSSSSLAWGFSACD
eukprot:GDKK01040293.1.p2 GENE.GDKK01040293.1~~GDKK01040293.1.p2  ORF type:complete len:121 (+),score=7.73 GDKK01040293.1:349-711(+)